MHRPITSVAMAILCAVVALTFQTNSVRAQGITVPEAVVLSETTGRPILAVAGRKG